MKTGKKFVLFTLFTAAFLMMFFLQKPLTVFAGPAITYFDEQGIERTCTNYEVVPATAEAAPTWGEDGKETWYAVTEDSEINFNVTICGDVHLILCDGKKLSGCALVVGLPDHAGRPMPSLTIYGQEEDTGELAAVGFGDASAAIGSWCYNNTGDITICGGTISATAIEGNAGIGGGTGTSGGSVTICGGTISASGDPAIGNVSTLSIEGMSVTEGGLSEESAALEKTVKTVEYVDPEGKTVTKKHFSLVPETSDHELVWGADGLSSWYVVNKACRIDQPIFLSGDVNLILCDGASLGGCSLIVGEPDQEAPVSLTIYCQEKGTGVLEAKGWGEESAAIGSWCYCETGDITIYGGTIRAEAEGGNAGIGGGMGSRNGSVTILGGEIEAAGFKAIGNGRGGADLEVDISAMTEIEGSIGAKATLLKPADFVVTYSDEWGQEVSCVEYALLADYEENELRFGSADEESWYVVKGTTEIDKPIFLDGDVNLILCDGATLKANQGIVVNVVDSLTIYCQEQGTGAIEAHNNGNSAAIGSWCYNQCGPITIYGGNITAISESGNAAGIGGGHHNNQNESSNHSDDDIYINIFGGKIVAKGHGVNAIGNGLYGEKIYVNAYGMKARAGSLTGETVTLEKCTHEDDDWGYSLKDTDTLAYQCVCGKEEDEPVYSKLRITQDRKEGKLAAGFTPAIEGAVTYQWYLMNGEEEQLITGATSAEYELPEDWENGSHDFEVKATVDGVTAKTVFTATAHEHYFTFEGNGSVITAVCYGDEEDGSCTLEDNSIELELTAPECTVYGGDGELGAGLDNLDDFKAVTGLDIGTDDIRYTGRLGTVYRRSATPPSHPGNYTATLFVDGATASVDYSIQKAVLTVTAKDKGIDYGDEPDNNDVIFDGFAGTDSEMDLFGELSYTYNYAMYDNVGTYSIIPGGLESPDYSFRYVAGKLVVLPAALSVEWEETDHLAHLAELKYNGKQQVPAAELLDVQNDDDVSLTVTGSRLEIGSGIAWAELTGTKAHNYYLYGGSSYDFAIVQGVLPDVTLKRAYIWSDPEKEEIDLTALLPADASDANWSITSKSGEVGYAEGGNPTVSDAKLTFQLGNSAAAANGEITLTATGMHYYEDCTVHVLLEQKQLALYEQAGKNDFALCRDKTITVDKSFQLAAKFADGAVTNERVVWASTNPDIASVTQDGKVTGRSAGMAAIRCYSEAGVENYAECAVTVADPATEISLDKKSYNFGQDESVTLNATVLPFNAIGQLNWTIDDKNEAVDFSIATDTMSATFTGKKAGTVKVTVETIDGTKKKATCTLNVGNATPNFAIAGKGGASAVPLGKTLNMVVDWGNDKPKNTDVIWTVKPLTAGRCAASISEKGVLSALSEGTVRVYATSVANPGKEAWTDIDIYVPVKNVSLNATSAVVSRSDDANPFALSVYTVSPVTGYEVTGETMGTRPSVTYAVDPAYNDVLSVDADGNIRAKEGTGTVKNIKVTATVKAYDFEKKLDCKVTVQDTNPLKGIKLSSKTIAVGEGNEAYLTATTDPVNPDGDPGVIYVSEDPSIAYVENGWVVGVKPGSTVITAKAKGTVTDKKGVKTNPQAICKVTVTPSLTVLSFDNGTELSDNGLAVGKSFTLKPHLTFSGSGKPASKDLCWESSDESIATVSQKGVVKALRAGRVTITVTSLDIKKDGAPEYDWVTFDTYTMVKSVKADRSKMVIGTRKGSEFGKISIASILPVNADNPQIYWTADNEKVYLAAVPADESASGADYSDYAEDEGVFTEKGEALAVMGVSPGTVKLTGVTADGSNKKITCTVTVRGEVTALRLETNAGKNGLGDVTMTGKSVYTGNMKIGSTLTLKAVPDINYVSGLRTNKEAKKVYSTYQKVTDTTVSFRSSNTSVAKVDKSGKITVVSQTPGDEAVIYVTTADERFTVEFRITVN